MEPIVKKRHFLNTDIPEPVLERVAPGSKLRIRPRDITVRPRCSAGRFGKCETEIAAGRLVLFFKQRGYWSAFTTAELRAFSVEKGLLGEKEDLLFGLTGFWLDDGVLSFRYVGDTYIVLLPDGTCAITEKFIEQCAKA
ncbi:MAG: hypothetical protein AAB421_05185 [Patescibacteria group bacterium]